MRDFRPIIRDGIGRLGPSTWPSGNSIWTAETEGRDLTVDQLEVSEVAVPDHVRSRMPLPAETERLEIAAGTPVVEICRVALDADGTPVEVNEMTAGSSAYIFRYEYGS